MYACSLKVRALSHGTLLLLTLKTSLNTNLVNIFNATRVTCRSSLTNYWYLSLHFKSQLHISVLENNIIFFNFNDLGTLFLNITLENWTFYYNFNKLIVFAICITKKDSKQQINQNKPMKTLNCTVNISFPRYMT